jgi:hypothetical protein
MLFTWRGWGPVALIPLLVGCYGLAVGDLFMPGADVGVRTLIGGLSSGALFFVGGCLIRILDRRLNADPHRRFSDHAMWNVPLGAWALVYWTIGAIAVVVGVVTAIVA